MKKTNFRNVSKKMITVLSLCLTVALAVNILPTKVSADDNTWNLGTATNTGKDNGYSGDKKIDKKDPHYGWTLGQFYVSGYTQHTTENTGGDVFLKNVGDKVELHFKLLQDIDSLNGDDNLTIYEDRNGYDQYFATQQYNDCRGLLIIRKTDYTNNKEEPVIYTDYLDGVEQGADTVVEFCEEGDYEVALDYEIKEEHYGVEWNSYVSVPTYTNYRIFFTFKIRNGNCMVFPFDTTTGSELTNEAFTENGFYLDLANSRYLEINVQRSVYVEGASGYTEDIRFNKPATDGAEYTDEGIYTITVSNLFTDQETTKVIYVGTDPIMKAYVVSGYTLEEIQDLLSQGYTVSDEGLLQAPTEIEEEDIESGNDFSDEDLDSEEKSEDKADKSSKRDSSRNSTNIIPIIVTVVIVLLGGVGVVVFLMKGKLFKKEKNVQKTNEEAVVERAESVNEPLTVENNNSNQNENEIPDKDNDQE